MKRNVEIKASVQNLNAIQRRAENLATSGPTVIEQEDTFFLCPKGRLKLRTFSDSSGELIFYERVSALGPSESQYYLVPTSDPGKLKEVLASAFGVRGCVRKTRVLYLAGQTRIHLDTVEGLGSFVELEVVLAAGQSVSEGASVAEALMSELGITDDALIDKAYIDLLEES
ncbi:MAG: class IV adenylate cyclase [Planctomycetota bacterium]|jgi:predicted adenylyl cyclase CyaB